MEREDYLALAVLSGIWGASFLFIKVAVVEIPPVWVSFGRVALGTPAMLIVLVVARVPLRGIRQNWRAGLVIGVFNAAVPYSLFAVAETMIDSSLAGILNATLPLWTTLMAPLWRAEQRIRLPQVLGLALGFAGVVVLARPTGKVFSGSTLGMALILLATLSYAFATHFSHRAFKSVPALLPAFLQCLGATLVLLPLAILVRPAHIPGLAAIGAVAALGIGGTGIAMSLAYWLIQRNGASKATVVTYLLPPAALFWGVVVLHEHPGPAVLVALALVLSGVFLITRARPAVSPVAAGGSGAEVSVEAS